MKLTCILLVLQIFGIFVRSAEVSSSTDLDAKSQLEKIWRDISKNIRQFSSFNKTSLCLCLCGYRLAMQLAINNPLVLPNILDKVLLKFFTLVNSTESCNNYFGPVKSLYELNFAPDRELVVQLIARSVNMKTHSSKIPSPYISGLIREIIQVQLSAVDNLGSIIDTNNLINHLDSKLLMNVIGLLNDYCQFYIHFNDHNTISEVLTGALKDCVILRQIYLDAMTFEDFKRYNFDIKSLLPLFLTGFEPKPGWSKSTFISNIITHDEKLEYFAKIHAISAVTFYSESIHTEAKLIESSALIERVFPTVEQKTERILELLNILKRMIVNNEFKDKNWLMHKSLSALVAYLIQAFIDCPTKELAAAYVTDYLSSMITCCFETARTSTKLTMQLPTSGEVKYDEKEVNSKIQATRVLKQFVVPLGLLHPDLPYWLPLLFELQDLVSAIVLQHVKKTSGSVVFGKKLLEIVRSLDSRVNNTKFALGKLRGEAFFKEAQSFIHTELVKAGFFSQPKPKEIKKPSELLKDRIQIVQNSDVLTPEPTNLKPCNSKGKPTKLQSNKPSFSTCKNTVVKEEPKKQDDLDALVAYIQGPKMKKAKKPVVLLNEENWDDDSHERSEEESTSDSEGEDLVLQNNSKAANAHQNAEPSNVTSQTIVKAEAAIQHVEPPHIRALVDVEDLLLTELHDVRDVAYGYLLIGNAIFYQFISPFIRALEKSGVFLYSVFRQSLSRFEHEIKLLASLNPRLLETAFFTASIPDIFFFTDCIKFYAKRLCVAHQYIPTGATTRRSVAKLHIALLYNSNHTTLGPGKVVFENQMQNLNLFDPAADAHTFSTFKNGKSRPSSMPSEQNVQFELSILGLANMFRSLDLTQIRHHIAHYRPTQKELGTLIQFLFKESFHFKFLQIAFKF